MFYKCSFEMKKIISQHFLNISVFLSLISIDLQTYKKVTKSPWVAHSVKHPILGFSSDHDLTALWVRAPHESLCWQCRACLGFSLSLSLCPFSTCTVSVSLKINFKTLKNGIYLTILLFNPQSIFKFHY